MTAKRHAGWDTPLKREMLMHSIIMACAVFTERVFPKTAVHYLRLAAAGGYQEAVEALEELEKTSVK